MDDHKGLIEHKPDYLICTCWGVMYSEIVAAIKAGAEDFQALQDQLMVGTGCSSCVPEINELLHELVGDGS
jgi:NAD(P)H-nitrite reductase large subunit